MTPAEFATYVRFMTRTNSTTFTDSDILLLMKVRQDELAKDIVRVDEDILLVPMYADLFAGQREYPFPEELVSSLSRVEAMLDGENYIKLRENDVSSIRSAVSNEALITSSYGNQEGTAYFDLARKSIFIYSGTITNVANGLRLWVNTWIEPITSLAGTDDMSIAPSSVTHGMPRELHEIWARGVSIDYKTSRENPIPLTEKELNYKDDKRLALKSLKPQNRDRTTIMNLPSCNNGWDY